MEDQEKTLGELFEVIEKKLGAYSRDHLTHASNVINNMSECGQKIRLILIQKLKHMVREAENNEIADVRHGLYCLLRNLGVKVAKDNFGDYYLEYNEGGH